MRISIPVERMRAWLTAALRIRVERVKACLMAVLMRLPAGESLRILPRQEHIPNFHLLGTVQLGMELEVHLLQVWKMATHTHTWLLTRTPTHTDNGHSCHCPTLESHHQAPSRDEVITQRQLRQYVVATTKRSKKAPVLTDRVTRNRASTQQCLAPWRNNEQLWAWRRATVLYEMRPSHQLTYMNYKMISERGQLCRNGYFQTLTKSRQLNVIKCKHEPAGASIISTWLLLSSTQSSTMMPSSWSYQKAGPTWRVLWMTTLRRNTWKSESSDYEEHITALDFIQSEPDLNLYICNNGSILLLLYVDNMLLTYPTQAAKTAEEIKTDLSTTYKITNLGTARQFLRIEIYWNMNGMISHDQGRFIDSPIKRFHMEMVYDPMTPLDDKAIVRSLMYIACTEASREDRCLLQLCKDVKHNRNNENDEDENKPLPILCDNKSALSHITNGVIESRTKHVDFVHNSGDLCSKA